MSSRHLFIRAEKADSPLLVKHFSIVIEAPRGIHTNFACQKIDALDRYDLYFTMG